MSRAGLGRAGQGRAGLDWTGLDWTGQHFPSNQLLLSALESLVANNSIERSEVPSMICGLQFFPKDKMINFMR